MKVEFHTTFIKIFNKRLTNTPSLRKRFEERTKVFSENPHYPLLHDHALTGKYTGYRSFSITGDIRVVYYIHVETGEKHHLRLVFCHRRDTTQMVNS